MDKNQQLADLYDMLMSDFTRLLKSGEASASDRSVIRQFLKDNNITSIPTKSNGLGNLISELQSLDHLDLVED